MQSVDLCLFRQRCMVDQGFAQSLDRSGDGELPDMCENIQASFGGVRISCRAFIDDEL